MKRISTMKLEPWRSKSRLYVSKCQHFKTPRRVVASIHNPSFEVPKNALHDMSECFTQVAESNDVGYPGRN
ncbi:hypothetical protein F441_18336 [Phytophthora nicotianae CJ01A1]|uniref:Uncharacterized protein n=3 Tax=Phytophthora nicotianae TaxID=4792 RepID=W2FXJ3_PHYNI|nr:hypothetical protein L915_17974 [Phytophthora nicotianae]ETL28831.1 hypothetical protein L916_17871 [Phytophthora nicotianae]ETO63890.1 hypothetical protein F444_18477 [Phytophthora nicotianae P1976]ETP04973.1 hypothetical protein F441_18336 [Phytophthora nicotianae CJ01A1]